MLYLTNERDLWDTALLAKPECVLSLLNPGSGKKTLPWQTCRNHTTIEFYDLCLPIKGMPRFNPPSEKDVKLILRFGQQWGGRGSCVVHCARGVSRSAAAILILLLQLNSGHETELCELLAHKAPHAAPNRLMIEIGDRLLGCGGKLVDAAAKIPEPWDKPFVGSVAFPVLLKG